MQDNEAEAEQVSQVIKSQSFAIKENSKLINTTLGVGMKIENECV